MEVCTVAPPPADAKNDWGYETWKAAIKCKSCERRVGKAIMAPQLIKMSREGLLARARDSLNAHSHYCKGWAADTEMKAVVTIYRVSDGRSVSPERGWEMIARDRDRHKPQGVAKASDSRSESFDSVAHRQQAVRTIRQPAPERTRSRTPWWERKPPRSPNPRPSPAKSWRKESSSSEELDDNDWNQIQEVRTAFAALKSNRMKSEALTLMKEDMDKDHGTWEGKGKTKGKAGKYSGGRAKRPT